MLNLYPKKHEIGKHRYIVHFKCQVSYDSRSTLKN